MNLLLIWIIDAVALLGVAYLMPSIQVSSFGSALIAAVFLGFVNMLVRPILVFLTLPVTILTLGLFIFVINALLFWYVGSILKGFVVSSFGSAFFGSLLYSLISCLLLWLVHGGK